MCFCVPAYLIRSIGTLNKYYNIVYDNIQNVANFVIRKNVGTYKVSTFRKIDLLRTHVLQAKKR